MSFSRRHRCAHLPAIITATNAITTATNPIITATNAIITATTAAAAARHLPGGTLDSWAQRPALLITDATAGLRPPVETKRRNEEVLAVLLAALRSDGSVLIPTDTAGRVLEIITVLDKAWAEQK